LKAAGRPQRIADLGVIEKPRHRAGLFAFKQYGDAWIHSDIIL
jgi:hypothetical protein